MELLRTGNRKAMAPEGVSFEDRGIIINWMPAG